MRPGDLIEFIPAHDGETAWSTLTQSWCAVGSNLVHTCVAFDGVVLVWINCDGVFQGRVIEMYLDTRDLLDRSRTFPRVRRVGAHETR